MSNWFSIGVGRIGGQNASMYGDKDNLDLAATHCFAGALMPLLRAARARGELTRAQYKRAKDLIENRMLENMQYNANRSWPYTPITKRMVREQISLMQ